MEDGASVDVAAAGYDECVGVARFMGGAAAMSWRFLTSGSRRLNSFLTTA